MNRILNAISLAAARARQGELPLWWQLAEMTVLWVWRRQGPNYYQLARFWRKDMPWRDKLDHLTETEYRRAVDSLNPERYRKLSQHKVVEKSILTLLGFRTPRFLGFSHAQTGRTAAGNPLRSAADLEAMLADGGEAKVCFKPVEGWGGSQFVAAELLRQGGALRLRNRADGTETGIAQFATQLDAADGYLIEAYLEQHPRLAALNPGSLNTLRIWVVLGPQGARVSGAILRAGRAGSIVDNTSRGGLVCPVDLATGTLRYADEAGVDRITHAVHPDSKAPIGGMVVPYWEDCKAMAGEALKAFPHMQFAGLDIAIGEDGPWIIELNLQPDRRGATDFDVPTAKALDQHA